MLPLAREGRSLATVREKLCSPSLIRRVSTAVTRSNATCRFWTRRRTRCMRPEGDAMTPSKTLHDLGQSLWLDNITRDLLNSGTLQRYIDEFSVTGLTSNPTIFDHAIKNSATYDADIAARRRRRNRARNCSSIWP